MSRKRKPSEELKLNKDELKKSRPSIPTSIWSPSQEKLTSTSTTLAAAEQKTTIPAVNSKVKKNDGKEGIQHCQTVDDILTTICNEPADYGLLYRSFAKYRVTFLQHYIENTLAGQNVKYVGKVTVAIILDSLNNDNDDDDNDDIKVAGVFSSDDADVSRRRTSKAIDLWNIDIIGAPFSSTKAYTLLELKNEWSEWVAQGLTVSHSNSVIVYHDLQKIEYFEPNGGMEPASIPAAVAAYLQEMPAYRGYMFDPPSLTCPRVGLQRVSGDKFCANWALLYDVLRLECPHLSAAELQSFLLELTPDALRSLMHHWICYLWNYAETHHFFSGTQKETIDAEIQRIIALSKHFGLQ